MAIKRVLVPVDFSPPSVLAVNYGVSLARRFHGRLILLHVLDGAKTQKNQEQAATCALSMLVSPEDQDDLDLLTLVQAGEVREQIEAAVTDHHPDFVVMGTHGRRLLGRLFIGSVTENLLRRFTMPLMTVCHASRPLELHHILFATDLSDAAENAFQEVLDLARTLSASLLLLHVTLPPVELYEGPDAVTIAEKAQSEFRTEMQDRLDRLASTAHREGIICEPLLVEGNPPEVILKEAADRSADLIAVGVAERGPIDRALFGSTAEAVIRKSRIPVLSLHIAKPNTDGGNDTQIVGHWERA